MGFTLIAFFFWCNIIYLRTLGTRCLRVSIHQPGLFMSQSENGVTGFSFDGYGNHPKNSVQISRYALASGSRGTVG